MKKSLLLAVIVLLFTQFTEVVAQAPLKGRDSTIKGPQTFAMVMGISKYKYVRPLNYADKDAQLFKDYLKSPGGGRVKEENIYTLLNEKANNSNFWGKGFQWLKAKKLQRGDRLFIYRAGHGDAIDEDQFFFLGYDCNPQGDKNNYLVAGTIQLYNLKKKIANETSKGVEVFFIMDACRSNELPGGQAGLNFLNTAISEKKAGEIIMLATAAGEESLEDASIGTGHGLFTYYLVDGLNGVADTIGGSDKKVTFREIQAYVDKNVPFVAQQRFKRKQDPFFCCTESSEKVISTVDTLYLKNWLKQKKQQNRGGGNSFNGSIERSLDAADTLLVETYNRFNTAVRNNRLTGSSSAEDYFQQLNKKFPGNPYTLDAKSTLAVEFINVAQAKVDRYLACGDAGSAREKQDNYQAALNLEKAIASVREDDDDFARSLMNRMYFLKASGDFGAGGANGDIGIAFQNAYAALRIDPNGAYIQNKLALLHLQNNNKDSALYYSNKAVKTAPGWPCALAALTLIQKNTTSTPDEPKKQPNKNPFRKVSFGGTLGGGLNQSDPTYSGNANSGFTGVASNGASVVDIGLISQINIGGNIFIRPEVTLIFENTSVEFQIRPPTGGQVVTQNVDVKAVLVNVGLPFIVRFSSKNTAPYISLAPSFSYLLSQDSESRERLPVLKSIFLGSGGLGVDIGLAKSGLVISPELRYTAGISEMKDDASTTNFSRALSSLKKNSFSLNVYLRKR